MAGFIAASPANSATVSSPSVRMSSPSVRMRARRPREGLARSLPASWAAGVGLCLSGPRPCSSQGTTPLEKGRE